MEQIKAARQQQALEMEMLKEKASVELQPPLERAAACLKWQVSEAEDARKNQQALVHSTQWELFSSRVRCSCRTRLHRCPDLLTRFGKMQ